MKRTLWILPLSLAAVACNKGEPTSRSTYTADRGNAPTYTSPGQRQAANRSTTVARAGTPAATAPRAATPYNPYTPPTAYTPPYTAPAPRPPAPPPMAHAMPTPPPMPPRTAPASLPTGGSFRWASSLREAQDAARASGRMVFIETGRPACGNCQGLRNEVIPDPTVSAELGAMVVGYYVDCDQEPNSQAYKLLVSNLPGAATLPLVGFFTPDLRWVHGYSGGRNVSRFRQEISTARSAYQRLASVDRPASPFETAALPTRGLASLPDEELADVSRELSDDRMLDAGSALADAPTERALVVAPTAPAAAPVADAPVLAEVTAAATAAEQADAVRAQAVRQAALAALIERDRLATAEAARAAEAERAEAERLAAEDRARAALAAALAAAPETTGTAIVSPSAAPIFAPVEAAAAPAATAPAVSVGPETDLRAWAQVELRRAAAALSNRDYASARSILASVREKASGAPEAREAAKGDAAIWNLRKIERAATSDDAGRLRARAKADLEATVFEALFA